MPMRHKILIIEDEIDISDAIKSGLEEEGYFVTAVENAQKAFRLLVDHWDLLILDLNLPDMGGETIVNYLKQQVDYPAILVLTARTSIESKISLFRQGCDDYLTKPFIFEELLERVRALLRRSQRVKADVEMVDELKLDATTYTLVAGGSKVVLTPKEASILRLLISSKGQVVSRKELLQNIWGLREEPETNFIGVHLFNLRRKLAEVDKEAWLQTVRNSGFTFKKPEHNEYSN
jgi:DNA-binding response OmpR family regulator